MKALIRPFLLSVCVLTQARAGPGAGTPLVINEFLASNSTTLKDGQSEWDDWIELRNFSDQPVDAGGMYLTDNLSLPAKWRIPAGTTVPARGYLLIWADGDVDDIDLHAGFQLAADGDEIGLFEADGSTLVDVVHFGRQRTDISFGRSPDGTGEWGYMVAATPGRANAGAYPGVVAGPIFNHERGFYSEPFVLAITTATEGAKIRYTLDGNWPTENHGLVYDGPIPVTTTTVVRAAAFKSGWLETTVHTHTFIFLADVIGQPADIPGYPRPWTWLGGSSYAYHDYEMDPQVVNGAAYRGIIIDALKAIPTLSLAADRKDMDTFYWGSGERPVSVEVIYPDEPGKSVQADCGAEPHSHNRMKRSLQLNFRAKYGAARLKSSLLRDAPLHGDEAADYFDKLILRGGNNRSWARVWNPERTTYTIDQWFRDTQIAMSGIGSHGTFVHLYINGLYWGLYNPVEQPNAAFASTYLGGEEEDWYSVSHGGSHGGDPVRWNYLKGALKDKDMADPANYAELRQYLDIENFIDYVMLSWFAGVTDWPQNNWWGANRNDVPGPFLYFGWDAEWSWLTTRGHNNGWVHPDFRSSKSGGATLAALWHSLRRNPDFMVLFADRAYRHLFNDGVLADESCKARYLTLNDFIRDAVVPESARWGDTCESLGHPTRTRDVDWVFAENEMLGPGFMDGNAARFIASLRKEGYYPAIDPPVLHPRGGHVPTGFALTITNPNTTGDIYYTVDDSDPRPFDISEPESSVVVIAESADKRVLVPTGPVHDSWKGDRLFDDSAWSAMGGGVGYERGSGYESLINLDLEDLMYGRNSGCYIRISFVFDDDPGLFDVLTLRMRYDDGFVAWLNGVEVCRANVSGEPAWNASASGRHTDSDARNLESFNVSASIDALRRGENILAIHGLNESTTSSDFLISLELVAAQRARSSGRSSTGIRYAGPATLTGSVRLKARILAGATWSALNEAVFAVGPVAENLRITEIMYHPPETGSPHDPNTEYVELRNIGPVSLNLGFAKFTAGIDFIFPSLELAAGAYVLVVKDIAAFEAKYGAGLNVAGRYAGSLDNSGERIRLVDAASGVIHDFRYSDNWYPATDGKGYSLTVRDPAATDPNDWDDKNTWRPSRRVDGSPGADD